MSYRRRSFEKAQKRSKSAKRPERPKMRLKGSLTFSYKAKPSDSLFFFSYFHLLCSHLSHLSTLSQNHPINKIYHTTIPITSDAAISVSSFSTSINEAVSTTITITSAAATIIYISTSSFSTSASELCLSHAFYLSSYQSFFFSRCIFTVLVNTNRISDLLYVPCFALRFWND
ncbi:hypothetical protein N665_0162s0050 [Sinapis alba]|nr:hypothetical protein N665_0162s0050 [Sinapis alba]